MVCALGQTIHQKLAEIIQTQETSRVGNGGNGRADLSYDLKTDRMGDEHGGALGVSVALH